MNILKWLFKPKFGLLDIVGLCIFIQYAYNDNYLPGVGALIFFMSISSLLNIYLDSNNNG